MATLVLAAWRPFRRARLCDAMLALGAAALLVALPGAAGAQAAGQGVDGDLMPAAPSNPAAASARVGDAVSARAATAVSAVPLPGPQPLAGPQPLVRSALGSTVAAPTASLGAASSATMPATSLSGGAGIAAAGTSYPRSPGMAAPGLAAPGMAAPGLAAPAPMTRAPAVANSSGRAERECAAPRGPGGTYREDDLIGAATGIFGTAARGLAEVIEDILKKQGRPDGYISGREAGGALVAGLRYGSGTLCHAIEGRRAVYWTGPSIGFDAGASAGQTFVLVYNLYNTDDIYRRFGAGEGQAYLLGGFNVSYMRRGDVVLVPVRMGVGLRLGVNGGYMKFSQKQNWFPF